jgi:hypothetical protein
LAQKAVEEQMPSRRAADAEPLKKGRSRVTNGKTLFVGGSGDARPAWARRLRDVWRLHLSDLGGPDAVSEAERSIARRAAILTVELERMEAGFAATDATPDQLMLYQTMTNSLRRLLETLGLKRRARDVTLDLKGLPRRKSES